MDEGGLEGEGDDGPFVVGNLDNFVARKISDGKGGLIYVMYSYCSSCK
jgi:hypothetical protein